MREPGRNVPTLVSALKGRSRRAVPEALLALRQPIDIAAASCAKGATISERQARYLAGLARRWTRCGRSALAAAVRPRPRGKGTMRRFIGARKCGRNGQGGGV